MKHFLILLSLLFCGVAIAETINITWHNTDGTTYETTTCNVDDTLTLPTAPTKPGYTFLGWRNYRPIEYLESTGTQYIDTGITPNNYTVVKAEAIIGPDIGFLFGSRVGPASNTYGFLSAQDMHTYRSDFYNENVHFSLESQTDKIVVYKNKNVCSVTTSNGNTYSVTNKNGVFSSELNIYLFGCNTNGVATLHAGIKRIYYLQIEKDNTLVRDFVPVLDPSGIPCMFDKVSQQFFYNAGTGNFIAGPAL